MLKSAKHWTARFVLFLGFCFVANGIVHAQAVATADRGAELAPFVQTTLVSPDWGPTRNIGYTVGVDYTRFLRSIVQPSLEFRFATANGSTVDEHTFAGGLKLQTTVHGIHPYGTFLVGKGVITFVHPIGDYLSDSSFVYSLGGGADFNVHPNWKVRLDFTDQNWKIRQQPLTPVTVSIGVVYRVPFHSGGWEH